MNEVWLFITGGRGRDRATPWVIYPSIVGLFCLYSRSLLMTATAQLPGSSVLNTNKSCEKLRMFADVLLTCCQCVANVLLMCC
jgi:hypothetical protein